MINYKNKIFKTHIHQNDNRLKLHLCYFQDLLNTKTESAKRTYFENITHELSNKNVNLENYRSLLKIFLNGKKCLPCLQFTIKI